MRRRRGFTLVELMAYLAGLCVVGAAALSVSLSADRDRQAVTAMSEDSRAVNAAADEIARDVRSSPVTVAAADGCVKAGPVTWSVEGGALVRTEADGVSVRVRRVQSLAATVGADGVVRARIELLPGAGTQPRRPSVAVVARPRVLEAVR